MSANFSGLVTVYIITLTFLTIMAGEAHLVDRSPELLNKKRLYRVTMTSLLTL